MSKRKQHELIKDACLTLGGVIEKRVPPYLDGRALEVVYDPPEDARLQKAKKAGTVLVSVLQIDATRSKRQSTNQPVITDEDEEGNLVEYRLGAPTFVQIRFLVTPWLESSLDGQVVSGAILQHFNSFPETDEKDIVGSSIHPDDRPVYDLDESMELDDIIRLWEAMGKPYRSSLVYTTSLKMDSVKRTAIRRVREKVNLYRKLEG